MSDPRHGWHTSASGVPYPPQPWHLGGELLVSSFRVPWDALPRTATDVLPPGHRPMVVAGAATVGVAFVHYTAGGVLQYEELLVSYLVTCRGRVRCTIPRIWVTSESSMHGGRELWGIPKELAEFERSAGGGRVETGMRLDGRPVALLAARTGARVLPGTRQIRLTTAQRLDGVTTISKNLIVGRLRTMSTRWHFDRQGPLAYLAGRRPVFSGAITGATVAFGLDVQRR